MKNLSQEARQSLFQGISLKRIHSLRILQSNSFQLSQMIFKFLESNPVLEEIPPEEQQFTAREKYLFQNSGDFSDTEEKETLEQHLIGQISFSSEEEEICKAAIKLAGNLTNHGFLNGGIEDLSKDLKIPLPIAKKAKTFIQTLDPPGIAAGNLQESLLVQIKSFPERKGKEIALEIIKNHLPLIEKNQLEKIGKYFGSKQRVKEALLFISELNPRPGAQFFENHPSIIRPDILVIEEEKGEFKAQLIRSHLPQIQISNTYKNLLSTTEEESVKEYIRKKIKSANELLFAIQQRQETLLKISQAIVDHQTEYFLEGNKKIRPLAMMEIAQKVNLHLSTISRACSEKYLQSSQGIIQMKKFFSANHFKKSIEEIYALLREIIAQENKSHPLGDSEIQTILEKKGVSLARRTVAKYREKLRIPSKNLRKIF